MFLEKIISFKSTEDKKHKVFNFLGIKLKIKQKIKFPHSAISYQNIYKKGSSINYKHSKAAIFVGFDDLSSISENTLSYLKEIRNYIDYLVIVYDNPIKPLELKKLNGIADAVIFERHLEYDFGSYKKGYLLLKEEGVLDKVENLLFINDSVLYTGCNLNDIFLKGKGKDFYGLTINSFGFMKNEKQKEKYDWGPFPHIQSFFFILSSKIFNSSWFSDFLLSVKHLDRKEDIIYYYEMGLSKLILSKGYKLNSYYKETPKDINPCSHFLNNNSYYEGTLFFIKKYLIKNKKDYSEYLS